MKKFKIAATLIGVQLISGCATPAPQRPVAPPPKFEAAIPYKLNTYAKSTEATAIKATKISTAAPIYYFQNSGGGGAVVGIAFGALGVLANTALIESATKRDVAALSNKIQVDPADAAGKALSLNTRFVETPGGQSVLLSPYVLIIKKDDGRLSITTAVEAESGAWRGRYSQPLYHSKSLAAFAAPLGEAEAEAFNESVEKGFQQAITALERDLVVRQ